MSKKRLKIMVIVTCVAIVIVFTAGYLLSPYSIFKKQIVSSEVICQPVNIQQSYLLTCSDVIVSETKARIIEEDRLAQEQAAAEAAALERSYYQTSGGDEDYYYDENGVLTRSGGVNYYRGSRETWYSSKVLHHYRTDEWNVGSDGVYRDSDGYVVVARSDMEEGSTVDTSLGMGKVYDSGCAEGTTDIYTAW